MALSQEKMGEIALKVLKELVREKGIPLGNLNEMAAEAASDYGITKDDARDFLTQFAYELVTEVYGPPPK